MDGREREVTNGELMRGLARIEAGGVRLEQKVDRQGDVITSINLRLTTIEAKQEEPPPEERRRSVAKPAIAWGSLGAGLLGLLQWLSHLANTTKGPTP